MSYLRAEEVLPQELIETIQQYVNGKAIYIPSVEKQPWGSQTDTKKYMMERNLQIFDKYQNGFSVNANGNKVDVWLIYRCRKCKHSWNMVIYERVRPQKIPQKLYDLFLCNDEDTACMYGNDISFLRRNNAEIKR